MFWNVSSATFDNFFSPFSTFFRHLFTCYLRTFSSFFRTLSGRMAECTVIQSVIFQTKTINLIAMLISRSIEWWIAVSEVERRLSGLFVEKQNNLLLPVIFRQYSATSPIPTTFSVKKTVRQPFLFLDTFYKNGGKIWYMDTMEVNDINTWIFISWFSTLLTNTRFSLWRNRHRYWWEFIGHRVRWKTFCYKLTVELARAPAT